MALSKSYLSVNGELYAEWTEGSKTEVGYIRDALGNVMETVNADGTTLNTYIYKPFGDVLSKAGSAPDPKYLWCGTWGYRANGAKWVSHYVRARHYSFADAAWTSVDPLWPSEMAYGYVDGRVMTSIDPSGEVPSLSLSDCKKRGGKACFHCANKLFATQLKYCPKVSCTSANSLCGTSVPCGPCGMCPTPAVPTTCADLAGIEKLGEFLRGSMGIPSSSDCSKSCGGYGMGDKLAHCFKGCVVASCLGITCGQIGKDDDPADNDAEWTGYWIGYWNLGTDAHILSECLKKCGDAVSGMECY